MKLKSSRLLFCALFVSLQTMSLYCFGYSTEELISNSSIQTLLDNKFGSIGGQDLQRIREQFFIVKIQDISGVPIGSCGRRLGMLNIPKMHSIFVPPPYFRSTLPKQVSDTWLLHEGLEAIDIFDENYGFSVGLSWLAQRTKAEQTWFLSTDMMTQASDPKQEVGECTDRFTELVAAGGSSGKGGGSTGTGGGGDPLAIQLKLEMMDLVFDHFKSLKTESEKQYEIHIFTSLLRLPLEAAAFQPDADKDALLKIAKDINDNPVQFQKSPSGELRATYSMLDLNAQPELRKRIESLILTKIYGEELSKAMKDFQSKK